MRPRITRRPEGGFAVELPERGGYTYVGWFDDFDSAADWAEMNINFFSEFVERVDEIVAVSDPPALMGPRDGWSMPRTLRGI